MYTISAIFSVKPSVLCLIAASLWVTACIPQGAGDYRIKTAARPTAQSPQPVPENEVIAPTPSWNPANVERNSREVEGGIYMVESGDTLYRVVSKTGASMADIAAANDLVAPYILKVGQQLVIPAGLYHNVNAGETGIAIARAYGVPWSEIIALNALQLPYVLNIGQRLRLPITASAQQSVVTDSDPAALSAEKRAAAFSLNIDDIVTGSEPAYVEVESARAMQTSLAIPVARPATFAGNFFWPLDGTLLSRFGSKGGGKVNDGINIAAQSGTQVRSAGKGVVVYSGNEIGVFGGLILIDHGDGWVTAYGHLGQLQVARGDKVSAGQPIGNVGETGYVSEPQLHFEIRKDRIPVDPVSKLSRQ
jgi:murein DD-endopeptidase MepM/ murein hydrolase activator NlpD